MAKLIAVLFALALAGQATAQLAPKMGLTMTSDTEIGPAHAFAIPVATVGGKYRMNLILNANAKLPPAVWVTPGFQQAMRIAGGTFPVRIWRLSAGAPVLVHTALVPATQYGFAQINGIQRWAKDGDVLAVEYTPALLSYQTGGSVRGPLVSIIDNRSNDPTTFYPQLTDFQAKGH